MRKLMILSFALCFVLGSTGLSYGYQQDIPVKWSQPPDLLWTALNIQSTWPSPIVADDWKCPDGLPVTDIHWWGSYIGWTGIEPPPGLLGFWFGFYTDVPAGVDQQVPWSHPGEKLRDFVNYFTNGDLFENHFAMVYDQSGQQIIESKFQYTKILPEALWFPQEKDTIYWLAIAAIMQGNSPFLWGWETSDPSIHNLDDAVFGIPLPTGGGLFWQKLQYPNGQSIDMAFELTTVPIPGAVWLLSSGLIGIIGIGRRFRKS